MNKKWMKLDNAALIYPPSKKKKYAAIFRLTLTFKEEIDKRVLEQALKNTLNRLELFSYRLKAGVFWYYLEKNDGIPPILDDVKNPMRAINFKNNNYFLFIFRVYNSRLALEFFHTLTDGTGGVTFLLTLGGEYLRLKYNVNIPYTDRILDLSAKPKKEELKNNFKKYFGSTGGLEKEEKAYHLKGKLLPSNIINIITGKISINELKKLTSKYNCTMTVLLASIMLLSIEEVQKNNNDSKKHPIKISIPVNLRRFFDSKTLRNFSSYVSIKINTKLGEYILEEIIKEVKSQMDLYITKKKLKSKFSANVRLENNFLIRVIPTFIKNRILSLSDYLMGDRYSTTTFSNFGYIDIPKEMQKFITDMGFMLGRSRNKHGTVGCISCMNNLYITFTSRITNTEFERIFFTKLVELGIKVYIESNGGV